MVKTRVFGMTDEDMQIAHEGDLPGVDGGVSWRQMPRQQPQPPLVQSPSQPAVPARGTPPPEDMYDTELADVEAQLNSVTGIQKQAIGREISQLQALQAQALKTATTPQPTNAAAVPAGTPQQVAYVLATGSSFKTNDGSLKELVSVAFTPSPSDPYFAGVDIWFTGYHGSTTPQLVASGTTSPVSFLAEITKETVTFTVQAFGSSGLTADFAAAPSATIALDGVAGAPPQPTVTQNLTQTPTGYQFEFSQEAGLEADVVSGYNVYRASSNSFGAASKVDHIPQDPTNTGNVVWQDVQASGVTMYYWITAVNTSGLESAPTACQSGAVVSGSGLNASGQLVTGTPSTPVANLDSGAARANTAIDSGNVVVAAGIDLSRSYVNKTLDNVPAGSNYTAVPIPATTGTGLSTKINLAGAAGVAGALPYANHSPTVTSVINSSGAIVNGTLLDNDGSNSIGVSHARAVNAIDSGNVVVAGSVDFARGYTGKHLGNVPDDAAGNRYAAVEASADKTINHVEIVDVVGTTVSPVMNTSYSQVPEMAVSVNVLSGSGFTTVIFYGTIESDQAANVSLAVYVDGVQQAASVTTVPWTLARYSAHATSASVTGAQMTLNYSLQLPAGSHTVAIYAVASTFLVIDDGSTTPFQWLGVDRRLQVLTVS